MNISVCSGNVFEMFYLQYIRHSLIKIGNGYACTIDGILILWGYLP